MSTVATRRFGSAGLARSGGLQRGPDPEKASLGPTSRRSDPYCVSCENLAHLLDPTQDRGGRNRSLHPVAYPELYEEVTDDALDGAGAEVQPRTDLVVGQSVRQSQSTSISRWLRESRRSRAAPRSFRRASANPGAIAEDPSPARRSIGSGSQLTSCALRRRPRFRAS